MFPLISFVNYDLHKEAIVTKELIICRLIDIINTLSKYW